eukprot:763218-Hanusia_phi.AAC.2
MIRSSSQSMIDRTVLTGSTVRSDSDAGPPSMTQWQSDRTVPAASLVPPAPRGTGVTPAPEAQRRRSTPGTAAGAASPVRSDPGMGRSVRAARTRRLGAASWPRHWLSGSLSESDGGRGTRRDRPGPAANGVPIVPGTPVRYHSGRGPYTVIGPGPETPTRLRAAGPRGRAPPPGPRIGPYCQ